MYSDLSLTEFGHALLKTHLALFMYDSSVYGVWLQSYAHTYLQLVLQFKSTLIIGKLRNNYTTTVQLRTMLFFLLSIHQTTQEYVNKK